MKALKDVLSQVDALLEGTNADASEREWIACEVLGIGRGALGLVRTVTDEQESKMLAYARERGSGKPLWQIFGYTDFCGVKISVNGDVLCPRPETEELALWAAREGAGKRVLDLCTGSGCIAVVVALSGARVTASDVSAKALAVAERNAKANGADVRFLLSDMWREIDGIFDVIVTNPPYIPMAQIASLDAEVREHEPIAALDGGADGLDFYREIARGARAHLSDDGVVLMEMGDGQARDIERVFADFRVEIRRDAQGKERMAAARLCGKN